MYRNNETPGIYRHKRHSIERLSSSVIGPDGAYHWLVVPDRWGESWYARSLADASNAINDPEQQR
jgi:hypothetical protein